MTEMTREEAVKQLKSIMEDYVLFFHQDNAIDYAIAALSSETPEGFVTVPKIPTQAMCQAGQEKAREWRRFPLRISPIYQAMLTAATHQEGAKK